MSADRGSVGVLLDRLRALTPKCAQRRVEPSDTSEEVEECESRSRARTRVRKVSSSPAKKLDPVPRVVDYTCGGSGERAGAVLRVTAIGGLQPRSALRAPVSEAQGGVVTDADFDARAPAPVRRAKEMAANFRDSAASTH